MFDLAQLFAQGQAVEAHGKKWITLYLVSARDGTSYYIAAEADTPFPAPCHLIAVPTPPIKQVKVDTDLKL